MDKVWVLIEVKGGMGNETEKIISITRYEPCVPPEVFEDCGCCYVSYRAESHVIS